VSGGRLALLCAVMAAGVLLPKAVPAALVGAHVGPRWERFLSLLPAATLGALVVLTVFQARHAASSWPPVVLAVVAATGLAILTRRTLLSMAAGWAVAFAASLLIR
jgi:branched-subunit amino acid transport protein